MQNIVLSGLHAIAFLVSPRVKLLDADFEAIQHTTSSESNFMAYLPGVINFESRLCTVDQRPRITKKESLWLAEALNAQTPLEVMVDNANDRRHSGRLKSVLRPDGVLGDLCFEVDEGLYCVLPELALVQAARTCTDTELVVLMSLLFGVFAKDAGANGLVPRRSVSSPAQVQRFVQRCRESCTKEPIGLSRVEGLLSCAVVKAASPKEIECALRLGYPVNLGGCGLGLPEMNYEGKGAVDTHNKSIGLNKMLQLSIKALKSMQAWMLLNQTRCITTILFRLVCPCLTLPQVNFEI